MTGRFVFRPIIGLTATVMVFSAPLLAADVDNLTTEEFTRIKLAYVQEGVSDKSGVDTLSAERMETMRMAYDSMSQPKLTFAVAQTAE